MDILMSVTSTTTKEHEGVIMVVSLVFGFAKTRHVVRFDEEDASLKE